MARQAPVWRGQVPFAHLMSSQTGLQAPCWQVWLMGHMAMHLPPHTKLPAEAPVLVEQLPLLLQAKPLVQSLLVQQSGTQVVPHFFWPPSHVYWHTPVELQLLLRLPIEAQSLAVQHSGRQVLPHNFWPGHE